MSRRVPALAFVMLLLGACAPEARREPATTAEPQPQSKTGLRLRIVPHVDMYYLVRYRAAAPPGVAIEPELGEAVTAARKIQEFFGTFGGWGPVDTLFIGADRLADAARRPPGRPAHAGARARGDARAARARVRRALVA
jgi:hypothetical protein